MDSVLIVGAGALACLFGVRLVQAGVRVSMLDGWREGVSALKEHGIGLVNPSGDIQYIPVRVEFRPEDLPKTGHAIVLVKSWQTEWAAQQLARVLDYHGKVLTLQNGLGNREALSRVLGDSRVLQGTTTTGATLVAPGQVRPGGEGIITLAAEEGSEVFIEMLNQAGFVVQVSNDLDALMWKKMIVNAAINPLTAMLEIPNGKILDSQEAIQLAESLAHEAHQVALASGVHLAELDYAGLVQSVAQNTATNHSSMLQDVRRGAPTEIAAICGEIVRIGKKTGVPTPVNQTFYQLIKTKVTIH